jgi:hypothetical protein
MKRQNYWKAMLVTILLFSIFSLLQAQPIGRKDNSTPPTLGDAPCSGPIDGGLGILVLLSLGYGIRKIVQIKKRKVIE